MSSRNRGLYPYCYFTEGLTVIYSVIGLTQLAEIIHLRKFGCALHMPVINYRSIVGDFFYRENFVI